MTNDKESVERFEIVGHEWGQEWCSDGEYVRYTDYQTLAAERDALKVDLNRRHFNKGDKA